MRYARVFGGSDLLRGLLRDLLVLGLLVGGLACSTGPVPAERLPLGKGAFAFTDYAPLADRPITVHYYNPGREAAGRPVLFVMHGTGRNAAAYRDAWAPLAQRYGVLLVVPEFSEAYYPGSAAYNLGNMFGADGAPVDEARWSFSVVEPLFEAVKRRSGSKAPSYLLYGHSAGAQFVHRFLLFKPQNRAAAVVVANAGWYTMPDPEVAFPYGLGGTPVDAARLRQALARPLVVLLGEADTDPAHPQLRRTPEALAQGPHRFARGQAFFKQGQAAAAALGTPFGWRLATVPGVGHSNAAMAEAAARLLLAR